MTPIIGDVISSATEIIGKFVPDADKRIEAQLELAKIADNAMARDTQLLQGQLEINKLEASSENLFVSGWRPGLGWLGVAALGYTWILAPVVKAIFKLEELPIISPDQIYPIIYAMLGIGGLRTIEKLKGVSSGFTELPTPKAKPTAAPTVAVNTSIAGKVGAWFK